MPGSFDFQEEEERPIDRRRKQRQSQVRFLWVLTSVVAVVSLAAAGVSLYYGLRAKPQGHASPITGEVSPPAKTMTDQQKLDEANKDFLNLMLATFARPNRLPADEEVKRDLQYYRALVKQEEVLDKHVEWPILGPNPSPEIIRLCEEAERAAGGEPTDNTIRKPGARLERSSAFKSRVIDAGRARKDRDGQ